MALLASLKCLADEEALKLFRHKLRQLLLAKPIGQKVTLGLESGLRTGLKAVVVDAQGAILDYNTLFPLAPYHAWYDSLGVLAKFIAKYHVQYISVGESAGFKEIERVDSTACRHVSGFGVY